MAEEKTGEKESEKGEKSGEAAEAAAAPAKSKKTLLMTIVGVVVLLLLIGIPVTVLMMKKTKPEGTEQIAEDAALHGGQAPEAEGTLDEDEVEEGEEVLGAIFPFETFVVNLSGGRYLRAQVQLEFTDRDVPKRFYAKLIPIRDKMIELLSAKNAEDLAGTKGKDDLKQQVKETINDLLRKEDVRKVYFTQFVIQ